MGNKDNVLRKYITNRIFADIFNTIVFQGQDVMKPEQLKEMDTVTSDVWIPEEQKNLNTVVTDERRRDMLKIAEFQQQTFVLFGLENQVKPDAQMPLRIMEYDARAYRNQLKEYPEEDLKPVVTLVIHWSNTHWNTHRSLREMMDRESIQQLQQYKCADLIQDYHIHVYEPATQSKEDFQKFQTELGDVFGYIKYSGDKEQLKAYIEERQMKLSREAVDVLNVLTNSNIPYHKNQEVIDMCIAIQEIRQEGQEEGRKQGKKEMLLTLYRNGISKETLLKAADVDEVTLERWLQEA